MVAKLENVSVRYHRDSVLQNVSICIHQGERVVVVGPSGAGKSTLLKVLNGSVTPNAGKVWLLGKDIGKLRVRDRRRLRCEVGTIYQDLCLVDNLRVLHNVNAGNLGRWSTFRSLFSLFWPLERSRAYEALAQVGIAEKMFAVTGTLSGGQQQRVAIAKILIQNPALVIADEPISSLDPERSRETMDLLCKVSQRLGKTTIVSCHSVEYVRSHFDRVIAIKRGRVFFDGSASQVTSDLLDSVYGERPSQSELPHATAALEAAE